MFDAVQSAGGIANQYFFGLAARTWTNYTFDDIFWNVNGQPDIEFCEVTWGTGWHAEAALVYLTDAYIEDSEGNIALYAGNDDGIGYYAGIVWNKEGINNVTAARRMEITESYFGGTRNFGGNLFEQEGNFGKSLFNMPDEVVYATGITLVDITNAVYTEYNPSSYLNVSGTGALLTVNSLPIPYPNDGAVTVVSGTDGNTDGFDLDAIRVFGYEDTASLTIEKVVTVGNEAEPDKEFEFTIAGPEDFSFGFNLKAGENQFFSSIPVGTYIITESDSGEFWTVEVTGGDANNPCEVELGFNDDVTIIFTNTYAPPVCYDETAWAKRSEGAIANNTVAGNKSNAWGWTNNFTVDGVYVMDLWAAAGQNDTSKGFLVGTVTVDVDGECVTVTYDITNYDKDYMITEAHLWVGDTPLPLVGKKLVPTAAPGQFSKFVDYDSFELDPDGKYAIFVVCGVESSFYVAAHAVIEWCEYPELE